jgi:hypothetical protein
MDAVKLDVLCLRIKPVFHGHPLDHPQQQRGRHRQFGQRRRQTARPACRAHGGGHGLVEPAFLIRHHRAAAMGRLHRVVERLDRRRFEVAAYAGGQPVEQIFSAAADQVQDIDPQTARLFVTQCDFIKPCVNVDRGGQIAGNVHGGPSLCL